MSCIVFDGLGEWLSMGACIIHNMSSVSWAMHVHVLKRHVLCIHHYGIVVSWGRLCRLSASTRV